MRVIKSDVDGQEMTCHHCMSVFEYTKYDLETKNYNWERISLCSFRRKVEI